VIDPEKPRKGGLFGMVMGAWQVIVSLLLSGISVTMFILWIELDNSYFGRDATIACGLLGYPAFIVGCASFFSRVHILVKFVVMVLAAPALAVSIYLTWALSQPYSP